MGCVDVSFYEAHQVLTSGDVMSGRSPLPLGSDLVDPGADLLGRELDSGSPRR